jgi:exopolysaccharide biosynthesis polyprenyl glycosylphosphotransferase
MIWKSKLNQRIAQIVDFITILSGFLLAYVIWDYFYLKDVGGFSKPYGFRNAWLLIVFVSSFVFVVIFESYKAYNFQRFSSLLREYNIVIKTTFLGLLINGAIFFIFDKQTIFPTRVIILHFSIVLLLLILEKTIMFFVASLVRKNYERKRVIVLGIGKEARKFISSVVHHKYTGIEIIGLVSPNHDYQSVKVLNHKILGSIDDIESIIREYNPEEIIIALQTTNFIIIQQIFESCAEVGVQLRVISDFFSAMTKNMQIDNLHGINFISFYPYYRSDFERMIKRMMDIVFSTLGIIVLSPILITISLMILIKDGRPVLFSWKVMGYNRKPIKSWKFRTMVNNADELKKELIGKNEMKGPMFKMDKDPRILPFAHFLRKYSLDELPQLFSVLKGDLSLVGPRPPLRYEFDEFKLWQMRKLSVKPGLTCLWQVSGRNDINDFDDWVKLDLEYIDNWSILLDIKILFQTILTVIKGSGK